SFFLPYSHRPPPLSLSPSDHPSLPSTTGRPLSLSISMPPKRYGAHKKRARNDESSSSYDAHLFPSRAHADCFAIFDSLPLHPRHHFDVEVLEFFDLPSIPGIQLNKLFNMMSLSTTVNEHAVKMFYCNLTDKRDEHGRLGIQLGSGDEVRSRLWT